MTTFYENIAPIHHLANLTNRDCYHDVPQDWYVALTDVRGSTQAMRDGRQKDVNAVAAASITALLNIVPGVDLPFVFGGDGATMLIPPEMVDAARRVLVATRVMAHDAFDLDLRVGVVPVRDVLVEGYPLRVAKFYISENFQQAIFSGGGLSHAEYLLKHHLRGKIYAVESDDAGEADFSGFECRWNSIPSTHDETVSLLVMATGDDPDTIYEHVFDEIERIYGERSRRHPISVENMALVMNPAKLLHEARIKHATASLWRRLKMLRGTIMAALAMRFGIGEWGGYKEVFRHATDHEKFDDNLRMTISGEVEDREALVAFLDAQRNAGQLVYGVHVSTHALVTCIVFDYFGRQVHFVDAGDGGYTVAATQMKAQLKEAQQTTTAPRVP